MVLDEPGSVALFRAGDEEALTTVYRACVDQVSRVAALVLRACATGGARTHRELAAVLPDVVQEVFVKAFAPEARRRFDASRPFEPYLAQIARNVAIDHWRQLQRYVPSDLDHLIDRLSLEAEPDAVATDDFADAETVAVVNGYLASLDEESRRVHDALYIKGLSQRDAATLLGVDRQVVRTKEAKLRKGLRRALARAGSFTTFGLGSILSKGSG
jgi:RNA polymerase sigma factor (sigma-70 family)